MTYIIRNIALDYDGSVIIDYLDTSTGVKTNGLAVSHALQIPSGADYDDGIEALVDAARDLLVDAIEDLTLVDNVEFSKDES